MKLEEIYLEIQQELLLTIARKIKLGEEITKDGIYDWQISKLVELGNLSKESASILVNHSEKLETEIDKLIKNVAESQIKTTLIDLAKSGKSVSSRSIKEKIFDLQLQAKDQFNLINSTLLKGVEQVYTDIITKSTAEVLSGLKSLDEAKISTVKNWIKKGIPTITDKSGRRWSLEAYAGVSIRSTVKNTQTAIQEQLFDENDVDLVEISSHLGARDSHEPYQGKIYSRSGNSNKYPPLSETNYGSISGIITGINCRHQMYAYFEGISNKRYTPYNKKENKKEYENQQLENRLNREIRKANEEIKILKEMEADSYEISKLKTSLSNKKYKLNQLKSR